MPLWEGVDDPGDLAQSRKKDDQKVWNRCGNLEKIPFNSQAKRR